MKTKVCGFLVLVIEEICVMEEREEWNVSTKSEGNEMRNAFFSFYHC